MFSVLALSSVSWAATYYVSNSGNDSANGTTASSPFKTISKVQSVVSAGDTVFFNSGDSWSASSGTSVLTPKGGVTYIGDSWGDGTRATLVATGKLSRAVIYFNSDDNTYETAVQGFHVNGNKKLLDLISICHNGAVYNDLTGATKRIQNCVAHDTGSGNYYYGIIIAPNRGNTVANVEIIDNEVYRTAWSAITVYPYFKGDTNRVRNVLIRNNYVHDTLGPQGSHGIMMCGDRVDDVVIEFNYIENTYDYGLEFASKTAQGIHNIVAKNNIVTGCKRSVDFWIASPGNNFDVTLYGNILMNNRDSFRFSSVMSGKNVALRVYNNVFLNNGGSSEIIMDTDPSFSVFELKNNIFYSSHPAYTDNYGSSEFTSHANNIFYRSNGGTLVTTGGKSYSSSTIKNFESTASSSEPDFKNRNDLPSGFSKIGADGLTPDTDGLSIATGTALTGGINLGPDFSESINSVTRSDTENWDIGAYQSQSLLLESPTNLRFVMN
jgi:hypothetical protein